MKCHLCEFTLVLFRPPLPLSQQPCSRHLTHLSSAAAPTTHTTLLAPSFNEWLFYCSPMFLGMPANILTYIDIHIFMYNFLSLPYTNLTSVALTFSYVFVIDYFFCLFFSQFSFKTAAKCLKFMTSALTKAIDSKI